MMKKWYQLPLGLVALHAGLVLVFWLWTQTVRPIESGAAWEYVFGVIDFAGYYTIGVPRFLAAIGSEGDASGSWAMALWFGVTGTIQWAILGAMGFAITRIRKAQPESGLVRK